MDTRSQELCMVGRDPSPWAPSVAPQALIRKLNQKQRSWDLYQALSHGVLTPQEVTSPLQHPNPSAFFKNKKCVNIFESWMVGSYAFICEFLFFPACISISQLKKINSLAKLHILKTCNIFFCFFEMQIILSLSIFTLLNNTRTSFSHLTVT